MKITVCIGSSCHVKGARDVVEKLEELIAKHQLQNNVNLCGTFCMGNCQNGVCVTLDDVQFSLSADTTEDFFNKEILSHIE